MSFVLLTINISQCSVLQTVAKYMHKMNSIINNHTHEPLSLATIINKPINSVTFIGSATAWHTYTYKHAHTEYDILKRGGGAEIINEIL